MAKRRKKSKQKFDVYIPRPSQKTYLTNYAEGNGHKEEHKRLKAHVASLAAQCEWRLPGWKPSGGQPGVKRYVNDEEVE